MSFFIGLDLGQAQDYTATAVVERLPGADAPVLHVRHLERLPLGTPYPRVVTHVQTLLAQAPLAGQTQLVVDATGVGQAVVDMLQQAGLHPIAIALHGGATVTHEGMHYRVPKRDVVAALQVLLQTHRLRIAQALPLANVLVQELLNFRVTLDPRTAHDSYAAWREGQHDDLVLAVALAAWWATWRPPAAGILVAGALPPGERIRQRRQLALQAQWVRRLEQW